MKLKSIHIPPKYLYKKMDRSSTDASPDIFYCKQYFLPRDVYTHLGPNSYSYISFSIYSLYPFLF